MKILGIILAVLLLTGSAFVGFAGSNKARDLSSKLAQLESLGGLGGKKSALMDELPSSGRLSTGSIVSIVAAIAAVGLLIVTFAKKSLVLPLAAVAVGAALVAAIIYPSVPTGPMDGLAPRPQEFLAAGLAVVGALGSLLAARKRTDAPVRTPVTA